jgi:hypothetical protein
LRFPFEIYIMSYNITTEKYNLPRIERIKHHLESCSEKGKPRFYELFVDNLKVVDKTDDPAVFDEYLAYMDEHTQMLKILVYTGIETSPRHDKFIFTLNSGKPSPETLNGAEIESRISQAIQQERDKTLLENLQKELEQVKTELGESEEYSEKLEEALAKAKQELLDLQNKKITLSEMNFGNVAGFATEYLVKNHPAVADKLPIVSALSGLMNGAGSTLAGTEPPAPETEAGFTKKEDKTQDPEAAIKLAFFQRMEQAFDEQQLRKMLELINGLIANPEQLDTIYSLVYPS